MHSFTSVALVTCFLSSSLSVAADRPNVLFIAVDDLNCDLGCYGHKLVKSPNINKLAARGVRFEKAYCQYPLCNPSRSSFLTSLYPDQTGVLSNAGEFRKKNPNVVTLPQNFMNNGYFVARVGKIFHCDVPAQIGTDGEDDPGSWNEVINPRGVDKDVEDRIHSLIPGEFTDTLSWLSVDGTDEEHTDGIGASGMIHLLNEHDPTKTGKPFFLAIGFYRPHTPYVAPSRYFNLYPIQDIKPVLEKPGDRDDIPLAALADRPHQRELTVPQRKEIIQAYYAATSFIDAQVGRLLSALNQFGLDDSTIIVFVSDHGYHLGAHGLWQMGDLFEGSCRVPMIIATPGMKTAGRTARNVVEMVDLYPTLCELCNITTPKHVEGKSLVPVLGDPDASVRNAAFTVALDRSPEFHKTHKRQTKGYTVRTGRYRYTEWDGGQFGAELYDYQSDPEEFTNLADSPDHRDVLSQMKTILAYHRLLATEPVLRSR